jgi:hypothetical protein
VAGRPCSLLSASLGAAFEAQRLGFQRVYFGTDGPGFYLCLGAVVHEQVRDDFWFMRFDLPAVTGGSTA